MPRRIDPTVPTLLWLCAAAVVHYFSYQGAGAVADVGHGKLGLRQFVGAAWSSLDETAQPFEVTFAVEAGEHKPEDHKPPEVEPPRPEKKPEEKKAEKKPEEKKPEEKKAEKKPEPPKVALKPEPLKPEVKPPPPKPEEPKPLPPPDKRVAVKQHVEDKNQKDNPTARQIADDANHVKDETAAKITALDKDSPKPTPGSNAAGPTKEPGNAEKTSVGHEQEKPGNDRAPPGEKSALRNDPLPKNQGKASAEPKPADAKPAPVSPKAGDNGRPGPKGPAAPAPTAPPPPTAAPTAPGGAPNTLNGPQGNYVINPFRSGDEAKPGASAPPPVASAPPFVIPRLGGAPGPKGVNFNLSPGGALAAIGEETIKRERELDGRRRKSAHKGSWKSPNFEKWKPAIENYVASVKFGNQTALNTAKSPFASYLNTIHNQLHPFFGDDYLSSLDDLPKSHPLTNPKLTTWLEVVVDGEFGRIVRMGVVKTSGVTAFDVAALDAMERASGGASRGFGKPPSAILSSDGNVYLHWEFHRNPMVACTTANARPYLVNMPGKGEPRKPGPRAPDPPTERGKAGQAPAPRPHTG